MTSFLRENLLSLLNRKKDSHKGQYGRILIVAGSSGMSGAVYFAAMGALRTGAGLVYIATPHSMSAMVDAQIKEAVVVSLPETEEGSLAFESVDQILSLCDKCDVLLLGPGLSRHPETQKLVRSLVQQVVLPVVLDADGLNAYEKQMHLLQKRKKTLILTPHYGEMSRLIEIPPDKIKTNKEFLAQKFVSDYGGILVLKDYETLVCQNDSPLYKNSSGNPGMATGGMGDILAGMISSLCGQHLDAFAAACLGVFLHGCAGDEAARRMGFLSLLPTDILNVFDANFWSKIKDR